MRKLISITLLFVLGLASVAPAFALGESSYVPACCRGNGAHKCMRMMAMAAAESDDKAPHAGELRAKCPCCPASTVSLHSDSLAGPPGEACSIPVSAHPAGVAQTESRYRIARDRSRQKRGPPSLLS